MSVHGIAIRERADNSLVEFVKCGLGREALMVLSGVRRNLGSPYKAEEEVITTEEWNELKNG